MINPIVRGWVNYYRIGNASRCFNYVRDWVEKKVRRHLMKARKRRGLGWKRWSKDWLYIVVVANAAVNLKFALGHEYAILYY